MKKNSVGIFVSFSSMNAGFTSPQAYMNPVIKKIKSFTNLGENWHFGHGSHIPVENIDAAIDVVKFLEKNSIINIDAFPGVAGEVQITGYLQNGNFLEVTINNPVSVDVVAEDKNDHHLFSEYSISLDEGKQLINTHKDVLFFQPNSAPAWSMLVSSAYITMTKTNEDSQVWLSDRHPTAGSQLSKLVAQ